jgi:hypothetical protein
MSFKVINYRDFVTMDYPSPTSIVEGFICRSELIILSAKAKSFKSMLTTNMALCCAKGTPFLDHFVTNKSRVLIVQTEVTPANLKERLIEMNEDEIVENLFIAEPATIKIDNHDDLSLLRKAIIDNSIDFLILDPLYTLHRGDENSASDMSRILFGLKALVNELNIGCILIHHQGKKYEGGDSHQAGQKHRGSSAFADVPDGSISLSRKNDGNITLSTEFRNRAEADPIVIRFTGSDFELISSIPKTTDATTDLILNLLKDKSDGTTRGAIMDSVLDDPRGAGIQRRTIDKRLRYLVDTNQIIKSGHGNYKLQNCTPL